MGRRFTAASNERIYVGSAGLNGLDYRYGTMAALFYRVGDTGHSETLVSTNDANAQCADLNIVGAFAGSGLDPIDLWDGTSDRTGTGNVNLAKNYLGAITKATGTATARSHLYDFGANTWTHAALSGTSVDGSAVTSLGLGGFADANGSDQLDSEVWAIGLWNKVVFTDSEVERLARGNWLSLEPSFYEQWSDGREVGDMARTLGRYPARQTTRTGTTRGAQKPPPGFRMDARRRRR